MKRLEKGFTLIELMIVVAIIAILAAVAAPRFGSQIKKARDSKALSIIGNWRSSSQLYYADQETYASNFGNLATVADATTAKASFKEVGLSTQITTTSSDTAIYVQAGTAALGAKKNIILANYVATDGAITIDGTSGTDTKSQNWSDL